MSTATAEVEPSPYTQPAGSDADMFIQWKGTSVCLDFTCPCGVGGHVDAWFAYHLRCTACGAVFQMGTQVIAKRLPDGQAPEGAVIDVQADDPEETP